MKIFQNRCFKRVYVLLIMLALGLQAGLTAATRYQVKNLISDIPGLAPQTDPDLINPWGLEVNKGGNLLVAINGSGLAKLYSPSGKIKMSFNVDDSPTGVVRNFSNQFRFGGGLPARWIFSTESGEILAFNPNVDPNNALVVIDQSSSGAVYKGLAIANVCHRPHLYAADFHNGKIDVFDEHFQFIHSFTESKIPAGFAPFNIVNISGQLYVTYAKQDADAHDDVPGIGNGFIDIFNPDGKLVKRLVSRGILNSPWGLALAPNNFGEFSRVLLVGNFGDGLIHAYNPRSGQFLGALKDKKGHPIIIDGLWSLIFHDKENRKGATLYFTAGLNHEADGLVGFIRPIKCEKDSQ